MISEVQIIRSSLLSDGRKMTMSSLVQAIHLRVCGSMADSLESVLADYPTGSARPIYISRFTLGHSLDWSR